MPHSHRIETTIAVWALVAGFLANFAGVILASKLAWPLSLALMVIGISGLIGAMLLIAAADRNRKY
jgi:hypothetical protein